MPFWKFLRDSVFLFPLRLLRLRQPLYLADAVSGGSRMIDSGYGMLELIAGVGHQPPCCPTAAGYRPSL